MELIERIVRAERQAEAVLRQADAEAEKIERNAQSNAEVLLSLAKRSKPRPAAQLGEVPEEAERRAKADAEAERAVAEERMERAKSFVLAAILGQMGEAGEEEK